MQVLRSQQESIRPRRVFYLVVLLLLIFRTFYFFPGMSGIYELWNVICFLYLVFAYPLLKSREHWKLDGFEWYVIALIAIVPIMSAVCAQSEFGQPILYGLLTERSMVAVAAVLFCMHRLRIGFFRLSEVKSALMILAWGTAIFWIFMRIALNPANYVSSTRPGGFVSEAEPYWFVLPAQFILIGVLYYALRGLRTGKIRNYLLALLLFTGAVDKASGRVMILALLVTFLFFAARWLKLKRLLILLPAMAVGSGLLVGFLYLAAPQIVTDRIGQFQAAFTVAFTGEASDDPSANGRIPQVLLAAEGIQKRPFFGSGSISAQWEGGYRDTLGARFYPEDIGLIGAVYNFGFIGLIFFASQYWFAWRAVKGRLPESNSALSDAAKGFIFYTLLGSTMFIYHITTTLFFIMLLRFMASRQWAAASSTAQVIA